MADECQRGFLVLLLAKSFPWNTPFRGIPSQIQQKHDVHVIWQWKCRKKKRQAAVLIKNDWEQTKYVLWLSLRYLLQVQPICVWVWPQSSGISISKQWAHTAKPHSTISLSVCLSVRTKKVECCWAGYVQENSKLHDVSILGSLLCKPQEKFYWRIKLQWNLYSECQGSCRKSTTNNLSKTAQDLIWITCSK